MKAGGTAQRLPFNRVFGCFNRPFFFLFFYTEWLLSGGSHPSVVQDGTGLAVDQTQFDKATHGLREALLDRKTAKLSRNQHIYMDT